MNSAESSHIAASLGAAAASAAFEIALSTEPSRVADNGVATEPQPTATAKAAKRTGAVLMTRVYKLGGRHQDVMALWS